MFHTPPLLTSLVLPPVQAAQVHCYSNRNAAGHREYNSEDDVTDTVVGSVSAFDVPDPWEKNVEVRRW